MNVILFWNQIPSTFNKQILIEKKGVMADNDSIDNIRADRSEIVAEDESIEQRNEVRICEEL